MTAIPKNAFRPTVDVLDDRSLPSAGLSLPQHVAPPLFHHAALGRHLTPAAVHHARNQHRPAVVHHPVHPGLTHPRPGPGHFFGGGPGLVGAGFFPYDTSGFWDGSGIDFTSYDPGSMDGGCSCGDSGSFDSGSSGGDFGGGDSGGDGGGF